VSPWDPEGVRLESFAPPGFEMYARVFHPAGFRPALAGALDPGSGLRWAALGADRGIPLSPDVSFAEISGIGPEDQHGLDEIGPSEGKLPPETCEALVRVLRSHTATETCWFCLWEGDGAFWSTAHSPLYADDASALEIERYRARGKAQDEFLRATPKVEAPARSYFLLRGPLVAAFGFEPAGWYVSPNIWWPDDRSWVVVTEIDDFSTYVGGARAAIEDVVASSELEAIEVPLHVRMDTGPYRPRWR
jgi:hypothetical protein